jgi:hypothetical protein
MLRRVTVQRRTELEDVSQTLPWGSRKGFAFGVGPDVGPRGATAPTPPESWETGRKDTVIAYPG